MGPGPAGAVAVEPDFAAPDFTEPDFTEPVFADFDDTTDVDAPDEAAAAPSTTVPPPAAGHDVAVTRAETPAGLLTFDVFTGTLVSPDTAGPSDTFGTAGAARTAAAALGAAIVTAAMTPAARMPVNRDRGLDPRPRHRNLPVIAEPTHP